MLITMLVAIPALGQKTRRGDRNQPIEISYGIVESVRTVKLKSQAGSGAALGGIAGLAAAHGSTKHNVEGAAAGAALGALIAQVASKHKAQEFVVKRTDGSEFELVIDHADTIVGDCVAIESGSHTNLRRVSPEMCEDEYHHDNPVIDAHMGSDAAACEAAKQFLLKSDTEDELDVAVEKVKILCHCKLKVAR